MTEDRKRQVATTRERYGDDVYQRNGAKSSGKGKTFLDKDKASSAAQIRWERARNKREEAPRD